MKISFLFFFFLTVLPYHSAWTDSKPKVKFTISVDWEGALLEKNNLNAMLKFRERFPEIPLVHFLNAAYFTQEGAKAEEVRKKILSVLRPNDELGLHLHGWEKLFTQAGVRFRSSPSFLKNPAHSLSSLTGEPGHDVSIEAYSVDELRKVIRFSLDQLAEHGFTGIESFRAGGWLAGPHVLEALAREGFKMDSSALPPSLVSDTMSDHPLYPMLSRLWPKTNTTSQPYTIKTPGGTLLEYPNNAGMSDYVNPRQFANILQENLALARTQEDPSIFLHYGFHEETAELYLPQVEQVARELKKSAAQGEFELHPIVLSENRNSSIDLPSRSWFDQCVRLFTGK